MTDPGIPDPGEPASLPRARLPKAEQAMPAISTIPDRETEDGGSYLGDHAPKGQRVAQMFDLLVESETDAVGLIAYSLTERTMRDWRAAFRAVQRREPTAAELEAFHLGEQLPRRLAAYRHMADDLLQRGRSDKGGIVVPALPPQIAMQGAPQTLRQAAGSPATWRYIGFMLLLLVVMAIVFRTAASWLFRA